MFIAIMSTLSERLKQARQHAGLTQDELAEKSGVTQASISKIELGKNKSENTTFGVQLAVACGVRCEWLVLGTGKMLEGLKPPCLKNTGAQTPPGRPRSSALRNHSRTTMQAHQKKPTGQPDQG